MPCEERNAVERRNEFIDRWINEEESITELCEWFGVSRRTGYEWIERYDGGGRVGRVDQSRLQRG
jgi:transposase